MRENVFKYSGSVLRKQTISEVQWSYGAAGQSRRRRASALLGRIISRATRVVRLVATFSAVRSAVA